MCIDCEWAELLETIEGMQGDERYDSAEETLTGIAMRVEQMGHCTANQAIAVENIKSGAERRRGNAN